MRVYVPATWADLVRLWAERSLPPPLPAFAVTLAARATDPAADDEELEYLAMAAAAAGSALLPVRAGPVRRVVVAADVPDAAVTPDPGRGASAVVVAAAVPLSDVVSVHVDGDGAGTRTPADAAGAGELEWYATQEIGSLLA